MTFTSFNRRLELRCGSLGNVFFREESIFGRMWRFFSSKLKMNIYWILAFLPQPWDYKDPWLNFQVGASDEKLGDNIQTWLRKLEEGSRLPLPEKCPSLVRLTWIVKWSEVKCYSILSFRITFSSKSSFCHFLSRSTPIWCCHAGTWSQKRDRPLWNLECDLTRLNFKSHEGNKTLDWVDARTKNKRILEFEVERFVFVSVHLW